MYAALQAKLPKGWWAWHSLRIKDGLGIDGEGDFVLAVPDRGLLVLEVKGGVVEVRDGRWFQNGRPMSKDPRAQGLTFAHKLVTRLAATGCVAPAFGVATAFPDCAFDQQPSQDDVAGRVLGRQDLSWLQQALPALVERALPPARQAKGKWIELLHSLWGETWVPRPSLGMRRQHAAEQHLALDAEQLAILDALADNERILVEGGAGTGKTLLALEVAKRFAAQGKRVLVACFTMALAESLRASCAEAQSSVALDVTTVRALAKRLNEQAGLPAGDLSQPKTWEDYSWAAADWLKSQAPRWDAVVIDEAQDLAMEDWALVEMCAAGGKLWVFRDLQQSFWPEREMPSGLVSARFKLMRGYRNPPALHALANAYASGVVDASLASAAIAADELSIVCAPSDSAVPQKIAVELDKLRSQGLAPSDIAVISLRGQSPAQSVCRSDQLAGHRLVRADDPNASEHIVADTFLRFKGLERPAIIVTDLRLLADKSDTGVRMHIALTRALVTARIVAPREVVLRDALLAAALE